LKNARGNEVLCKYGSVEFLLKYSEFLQKNRVSDAAEECQEIIQLLLRNKAAAIKFDGLRNDFKDMIEST
jgi:hypothetical protein